MDGLAPGSARLFRDRGDLPGPGALDSYSVVRLLEDGDREDLRALAGAVGESELRRVFAARGGRQLSRRSRAFWRLILQLEPSPPHPAAEEIWPL